jgi:ribonuclease HI
VVPKGPYASGADPDTTNQRMEVTAVLEALRAIDGPMTVFSDSTYVVNCFRDRWYDGWVRRGWKNSQGKAVANQDLWKPLLEVYRGRTGVNFRWVRGHSGDVMNDVADELAVTAAKTQQGAAGASSSAPTR